MCLEGWSFEQWADWIVTWSWHAEVVGSGIDCCVEAIQQEHYVFDCDTQ